MAKEKTPEKTEAPKEYTIPLRKEWRKVANYRRTGRAVKEIKKFIARHMKIPDRDISKVKLDIYLNQEIWFKGKTKPPARIKVKARKEGDLVKVELAELPEFVKFEKAKKEKIHKPSEKPKAPEKHEEEKQTEEEKKEEKEKSQSAAEQKASQAKQQAKQQAKTTKVKETPIRRLALKK